MVKRSKSKALASNGDVCKQRSGSCFPVPLEAPLNVGILLENGTTIKVTWAAVDKETVRGHLLGYKVPPMLYLLMNNRHLFNNLLSYNVEILIML